MNKKIAAQFRSLVSLLIDKRLNRKSGIYKSNDRERLELSLAVPKLETVVAEPSALPKEHWEDY